MYRESHERVGLRNNIMEWVGGTLQNRHHCTFENRVVTECETYCIQPKRPLSHALESTLFHNDYILRFFAYALRANAVLMVHS